MDTIIDQKHFIHSYIDRNIPKFNPKLFIRSDDAIIDQLCKIILSCQTNGFFKIHVTSFEVVDDYVKIQEILRNYYDVAQKTRSGRVSSKNLKEYNRYNYIDLKSSDIRLLLVNYRIAIKDEEDTAQVIIAIPKVVHKFYFYLNGNYYSSLFQIVDASTYNNTVSKSKSQCVTMKTNLQPIRIYRHQIEMKTTKEEEYIMTEYDCNVFKKTVPVFVYIFARFGFVGGLAHMNISNAVSITDYDLSDKDPDMITFKPNRIEKFYVSVPRMLADNPVIQHAVVTILTHMERDITVEKIFDRTYWVEKLGSFFSSSNRLSKGYNVLRSIEGIYDINIKEQIHLPYEQKKDIYSILRWFVWEYGMLRQKDNQDITNKKLRCAEYIAVLYAIKLSTGIYRLSNQGNRVNLKSIKRVIYTQPMYVIQEIIKCQLNVFRNIVTDMDSLIPIKFTYKGVSGIGEKNSSIPDQFRLLDVSNMGVLDPDASSPSDPGVSGSIVPLLRLKKDGYFRDLAEPNTWQDDYKKLYSKYRKTKGLQEVMELKKELLEDDTINDEDIEFSETCSDISQRINNMVARIAAENAKIAATYPSNDEEALYE